MNKGSIVERLCSDLDREEPQYKSPTLLYFLNSIAAIGVIDIDANWIHTITGRRFCLDSTVA